MRLRALYAVFVILALGPLGFAQTVKGVDAPILPPDFSISAVLRSSISTTRSKVGDRVEFDATKAKIGTNFVPEIINLDPAKTQIPNHTRLIGRVVWVRPASKTEKAGIAIRCTELREGDKSVPLDGKFAGAWASIKQQTIDVGMLYRAPGTYNGNSSVLPTAQYSTAVDMELQPDSTYGSILYSRRDFSLGSGEASVEVVAFEPADRTIYGTVFDSTHTPVSGASVILAISGVGGWAIPSRTDGGYSFDRLSPNTRYVLRASYHGEHSQIQTVDPIFFSAISKLKIDLQISTGKP